MKILIANRGEIAARIARTATAIGARSIAVYSDADAGAYHVRCADEAVRIGPAAPRDSYLSIPALLEAARLTGATCVHPGYGFLAENAEFARAVAQAGLVFIGPSPDTIALMGDKAAAKRTMEGAGVPCIPGYHGDDQSDKRLRTEADALGYPILLKASAGGGGKGMRTVSSPGRLNEAIALCRHEAEAAFGDDRLLVERALSEARHVEVQILADHHGAVVHLGERDCSVQRRHQKVIEETPCPILDDATRRALCDSAVTAAQAIGYRGAGTVECLLDTDTGLTYFMEMNTRLQVEHPVTEMVTGLDLVALQIDIAHGRPLPMSQDDVQPRGHAIEARLYAEDPRAEFLPQSGTVTLWSPPTSDRVRVDAGVETGDEVSPHYDPLIAKVIAHGDTREAARRRLAHALEQTPLLGFTHNLHFLLATLRNPLFKSGDISTRFRPDPAALIDPHGARIALLAAAACTVEEPLDHPLTGWTSTGAGGFPIVLAHDDRLTSLGVAMAGRHLSAEIDGEAVSLEVIHRTENRLRLRTAGREFNVPYCRTGLCIDIAVSGHPYRFEDRTYAAAESAGESDGTVRAPMAGAIVAIHRASGDRVSKGDPLVTLEAMKMQHVLTACRDGIITDLHVAPGDQVDNRQIILVVAEPPLSERQRKHG